MPWYWGSIMQHLGLDQWFFDLGEGGIGWQGKRWFWLHIFDSAFKCIFEAFVPSRDHLLDFIDCLSYIICLIHDLLEQPLESRCQCGLSICKTWLLLHELPDEPETEGILRRFFRSLMIL